VDDLLPIGRFARLSGLSVGALRHYDELDLLRPARTDPFTNYRLYRRDQLDAARTTSGCATSRSRWRRSASCSRRTRQARRCLEIIEGDIATLP
jgi:hypothetical protein